MNVRAFLGISLLLMPIACAPLRDPTGLALRQGRLPVELDKLSLRAELGILVRDPTGVPPLSARFYAGADSAGATRYRLDVFGIASVAASWFSHGEHWTLLLHQKQEVWEGEGDSLPIPGVDPARFRVGAAVLFGFLIGKPLPGFQDRDSGAPIWSGDTLRWTSREVSWAARYDTSRGICLEVFSPGLRIRYGKHRGLGNRVVPREMEILSEDKPVLSLRVSGLEDVTAWKKDPFAFSVPTGYSRRGPPTSETR